MKTILRTIKSLFILALVISSVGNIRGQVIQLTADTIRLTPEIPDTVNLLANDIFPSGDSIRVYDSINSFIRVIRIAPGIFSFTANPDGSAWGMTRMCYGIYHVIDYTLDTTGLAYLVFIIDDHSYDSIYMNNINARFNACGNHFWGPDDQYGFEAPKFSGKSTICSNAFWIGGLDEDSSLHVAAECYRSGPYGGLGPWTKADFWAGPVMDSSAYSVSMDNLWNYLWNLKRSDIEYHKTHWFVPGYAPIHDILTWPGNGDTSAGQAARLAPYFDKNKDGHYNPQDGDYPLIKGDQSLFFIFNDDRKYHSETTGNKLQVEIHGMAYEFDMPDDSAFRNTVFLNYEIFNRSGNTYHNTYIGTFTDFDIGYYNDDYLGCDVERSSCFGYNGRPVDGSGQARAYGANPPAEAVTILGGPKLDADGIDNPRVDNNGHQLCNESVNGLNFGDGITDNERMGMRKFMDVTFDPVHIKVNDYYYKRLQARWTDSTRLNYGGEGYEGYPGSYGPYCDFMFPGESDSLNWGVGCQAPDGPVNWTTRTAEESPYDYRGIASMGPFTFHPGDVEELDLAFVFARDYTGQDTSYPSVNKLGQMIDIIRNAFITNKLPNGNPFSGINDPVSNSSIPVKIYPNPASTSVTIEFDRSLHETTTLRLIDSKGTLLRSYTLRPGSNQCNMNVSGLEDGIYLINILMKDQSVTKKISVIRQ
jgi:hypothetical protein